MKTQNKYKIKEAEELLNKYECIQYAFNKCEEIMNSLLRKID